MSTLNRQRDKNKNSIIFAVGTETDDLEIGTDKITFRMPYEMELTDVRANVNTAPTGSGITVDINLNGTSIFSTLLTIDADETTSVTAATAYALSTTTLTNDTEITVDIDAVGSSTPGKGLKITLIGY